MVKLNGDGSLHVLNSAVEMGREVSAHLAALGIQRPHVAGNSLGWYTALALAGALSLFLLSLAGVPLTSGFVGKLVVFGPAIDAGFTWLVVVGMVASAIAAFFYLRIMVVMYMQEPNEGAAAVVIGPIAGTVVGLAAVATIVFGLVWGPLYELAERATLFFNS